MKNLIKYGCYALLAVVCLCLWYLLTWFVLLEGDILKWGNEARFFQITAPLMIASCIIGIKEM